MGFEFQNEGVSYQVHRYSQLEVVDRIVNSLNYTGNNGTQLNYSSWLL